MRARSTELEQLHRDLEGLGHRVVLADAGAWIRDDAPITHQDILLALVLSLYPEGKPTEFSGWITEYAKQVREFLVSEVSVEGVSATTVGNVGVEAALTTNNTLFQLAARRLGELRDLREKVFRLLEQAALAADHADEPLVIILDGIEKRATGDLSGSEEREKYRNHWFGAFLTHAADLRPPVHVVYTVPPFMIRRAAELGAQFGHELLFLPMVRVFERSDDDQGRPLLHRPGVAAMCAALRKRVPAEHFDDPGIPAWLAVHSGGYMRDLLRLVIDCIYRVPKGGKITRAIADQAIVQVRQTYLEGLDLSDESLLAQVHRDRDFPKERSNLARMDALMQGHLMLRYHNSHFWYDAHPLLWDRLGVVMPPWEQIAEVCS
ncbi:hypothetical protein G6O69_30065 [Pseudenhygromyxa sp. WMMC2535]|uniref:hypothetical protein n=1 Tax=Pseudenhygromyxa sp. WMMC2535 TaxID=2712867 RepID=UPI00155769E0|nr:hypothetical protein [Pseudenhygromyxa sp. WMMC2535]NVB42107.1 hypothetical protein [Pseudenhygromyxa sp. WMMC2535]